MGHVRSPSATFGFSSRDSLDFSLLVAIFYIIDVKDLIDCLSMSCDPVRILFHLNSKGGLLFQSLVY